MIRIDAADLAAVALRRLRREQDAADLAASRLPSSFGNASGASAAALATTRGEAVRAVEALAKVLHLGTAHLAEACAQIDELHRDAPIHSATLTTWADAWEAYAAREAAAADGRTAP